MSAGIRRTWGPRKRAGMGARCERACIGPVHACMGTPHASGRGDPERACMQGPVRACMETERAWGPGACVRGDPASEQAWGPGARVHRDQAGVGTRCERARWALRASGRGDPVRACEMGPASERARGPGASVRDGPCERAGVGTWCKQACVGPVHACVGPVHACMGPVRAWIQRARTRACRDPARTASSSTRVPVSIQHVKK